MSTQMPRRVVTAYWLIVFGCLEFVAWGVLVWMFFDDSQNLLAEFGSRVFSGPVLGFAVMIAMVVAGFWMKSAQPRGHYLAVVALALPMVFELPRGINGDILLSLGFIVLIVGDIRKLRSSPEFSLTVDSYRLADFWALPWLVTASCIALVGYGQGAIPAIVVHVLSPAIIGYIFVKLRAHPVVRQAPLARRHFWSLVAWALFYAVSIVFGMLILSGLSGLAMQGAGR